MNSFLKIRNGSVIPGIIWVLALFIALPASASFWSQVEDVSPGTVAAIGGPANGCIAGAHTLPEAGRGFVSIRRHRNRYYGHPATIQLIEDLGKALSSHTDMLMMVGDLSQPRGGRMSSMHRSHQNGMDVDIWYQLTRSVQEASKEYSEASDPESMVTEGGLTVSEEWGELQSLLIKMSGLDQRVDRIFVNPAIKQALCRSENGDQKWLRKLRPWWGHDSHFHIRLKCPENSTDCVQQPPPPEGDGCDQSLAWWFSDEARTPVKKPEREKVKSRVPIPAACQDLISDLY